MNRRERRAAGRKPQESLGDSGVNTPAALYAAGVNHLQGGRYLDAQVCCQQALAMDSSHADSLHLIGLLSFQARQYDHAVEWISRAIRQDPKPEYLSSLGIALQQQGRHQEALKAFDKAVQLKPEDSALWKNFGNALIDINRPEEALLIFQHVLKLAPQDWNAAFRCGFILHGLKRHEEALSCFDRCNELKPNQALIAELRADAFHHLKRFEEALAENRRAHALNPENGDTCNNIGVALQSLGRDPEALPWFDRAVALRSDYAAAFLNKAFSLQRLQRFDEALLNNQRALTLDPGNAGALGNMSHILAQLPGREEEALQYCNKALELQPDFLPELKNKAFLLTKLHRFKEVIATYDGIKKLDPDDADTDWNLALIQMLTGNFEAGWAGREARRNVPSFSSAYPKTSKPMWLGQEPVEGKTVLVYADEGLGDSIQFARYVPMLAGQGARVILIVDDAVHTLLSGLSGVAQCLPKSAGQSPAFDMHCPLSSLPLAFGTRLDTIPPSSCLPPPAAIRVQAWNTRLGQHDRPRVGLVWSGNPKHKNDHNRSIPLGKLSRILELDATFVSLQKDPRPGDEATLRERPDIIDLTAGLTDLSETAALIGCLDLVITVDTSVAHLAAALGRPTWILLPYTPDYRWLLDRDDSPWYPSVRLFRQTETCEYESVLARMRGELLAWLSARTC
jgi:tetratricopeptide (TPR) repeat protein